VLTRRGAQAGKPAPLAQFQNVDLPSRSSPVSCEANLKPSTAFD
jgi:hypothetical protein